MENQEKDKFPEPQTQVEKKKQSTKDNTTDSNKKIAVILIRGLVNITKPVKDTLKMIHLTHKNNCVVLENNKVNQGMIKKVKDYTTWGEINQETYQELIEKRGAEYKGPETDSKGKIKYNRYFISNNKKHKKYFCLNSPKKGFGRKGIKNPFKTGGALGYRKEKINDLIKNML